MLRIVADIRSFMAKFVGFLIYKFDRFHVVKLDCKSSSTEVRSNDEKRIYNEQLRVDACSSF